MDQGEALANYLAITGEEEAAAIRVLELNDWRLEQAVNHFYAAAAAAGADGGGPQQPQPQQHLPSIGGEDSVRAPMATKVRVCSLQQKPG